MSRDDFPLEEWELQETFIRSAGPGGQNVNKVSSGVQLRFSIDRSPSLTDRQKKRLKLIAKHLVTKDGDFIIEATRFRTQQRNRIDARDRLRTAIEEASRPPPPRRIASKPTKGSIERRLDKKTRRGATKKMRYKPASED